MKNKWLLSILCLLLFFSGCEQLEDILGLNQEDNQEGTISFYSGKTESSSSSLGLTTESIGTFVYYTSDEAYLYLKKIEISETGEEWFEVFISTPAVETEANFGENIRIGNPINISPGQYHGVRLSLEPKVRFTKLFNPYPTVTYVDITLEKEPNYINLTGMNGSPNSVDSLIFTSANGTLIPFDVENGKETFFIFNFRPQCSPETEPDESDWGLKISVNATRFLY